MSKRTPYRFEKAPHGGKVFWTSLESKADPEAFQRRATAEFPGGAEGSEGLVQLGVNRRSFLQFAGLSTAMAAVSGCVRRPEEKILPYTIQPEYVNPGTANHYATVMRTSCEPLGLLVTTYEGRPTKVEGNPQHPSSGGGTDGYAQAAVLNLYDPDRSTQPAKASGKGLVDTTFEELDAALDAMASSAGDGSGLCVLMQPAPSPTMMRVEKAFLAKFPQAKVYRYEPISAADRMQGAQLCFGKPYASSLVLRRAKVILTLDADILGTEPGSVRYNRAFADGRRVGSPEARMNRLYTIEPTYTVTGATADHRLPLPAREVGAYAKALAKELVTKHEIDLGPLGEAVTDAKAPEGVSAEWISAVAAELASNRGECVVTAGIGQPAAVHALVYAINHGLRNIGFTVRLTEAEEPLTGGALADISALVGELQGGTVKALVILGGNPVVDAPADLKFADAMAKASTSVHFASHRNETSERANWHAPRAHEFECWGDLRGSDGALSIQQPLIAPLRGGRADIEVLGKLAGLSPWNSHALVRTTMQGLLPGEGFEQAWDRALFVGGVRGSATRPVTDAQPQLQAVADAVRALPQPKKALSPQNLELHFAADPALFDGRYGNNPWMLELPHPLSCISWDNAAYMSPATAAALGLENKEMVELKSPSGATLEIVTWVLPGHADNSVTLHVGWGLMTGRYSEGSGFNVYPLRTTEGLGFVEGATARKVGRRYPIAQTQETHSMEGRPVAIDITMQQYKELPHTAQRRSPTLPTTPLWAEVDYQGQHQWSMVIDLTTCTGCNACLVACQAENNVSSVGKEQVARGRDMYWLRLDRYFVGEDESNPQVAFQPVGCQHCEEAPCENVCPVNATAHSPEGLNDMAYNRCIGTRYCMNNCPYKVRRFNFLDFVGQVPETRRMQYNPNVTVRMRGVMEKCTYCVQRIQQAKIAARREERTLRDGDVVPACGQACPSGAILFGDLSDERALVSRISKFDRAYKLLPEIGTQPRTTFLARIRNPNPEMQG